MKDNIILIGMPGAGKSTVGVVLAKALGYNFVDSDLVIQKETGKRLFEIIDEVGIDEFLNIENRINAALSVEKSVVATGGSVIYGEEAMEHLKSIGKVIYLKTDYESLEMRLGNLLKRGVAIRSGNTLLDLYNERVPLYEMYADITIDTKNKGIREVVEIISKTMRE
ncbi:MAG: shikimate kinase [Frisingicoccus sp.]|nr:shikimate kinase [Frisingicoccus sp.]